MACAVFYACNSSSDALLLLVCAASAALDSEEAALAAKKEELRQEAKAMQQQQQQALAEAQRQQAELERFDQLSFMCSRRVFISHGIASIVASLATRACARVQMSSECEKVCVPGMHWRERRTRAAGVHTLVLLAAHVYGCVHRCLHVCLSLASM